MPSDPRRPPLEIWGGVECTVNRVRDTYYEQLERNGHATRIDDLDRFAALGIRALRYPILWERIAPNGLDQADWTWADERLGRLRDLGIRPIVGLVHHGSGPRHTSLVDHSFVDGLAAFARAAAERYPWIEDWTPVNEPLTTARFSGLYGHWYPHGQDDLTFSRALLTQCAAIAAAMRAIRSVNPAARLVQTEDIGKIWSTPALRRQAEFENERRWLSFDLLCGRVDANHWMWHHMRWLGLPEDDLTRFLADPCPPNVLGVNHYLTSERFLDERLDRYPPHTHGGTPRRRYADVEAVRVLADDLAGPEALLRETWHRYHLPLAVTEAHLGCTREEQLRWLAHVWDAARTVRDEGADVRAVTAWSLLGAFDWNSLLTRADGHYEPGVFDLRAPRPRPTALAGLLRDLAGGHEPGHPVLGTPGWWQRPHRLLYPPVHHDPAVPATAAASARHTPSPLLIVDDNSPLAAAFIRFCETRSLPYRHVDAAEATLSNPDSLATVLAETAPWAVIAADHARPAAADHGGSNLAVALATACAERALPLLSFSSALVFDGARTTGYVEGDPTAPVDGTGEWQAETEARVLAVHPGALIVRTGPLFGPWDAHNPVTAALRTLTAGAPLAAPAGTVSPTYLPHLADACLDLLIDAEQGLWHLANEGSITWVDLFKRVAADAGLDPARVRRRSSRALASDPAPRHRALASERGWIMPSLDDALARYTWERDRSLIAPPEHLATPSSAPPLDLDPWVSDAAARRAS